MSHIHELQSYVLLGLNATAANLRKSIFTLANNISLSAFTVYLVTINPWLSGANPIYDIEDNGKYLGGVPDPTLANPLGNHGANPLYNQGYDDTSSVGSGGSVLIGVEDTEDFRGFQGAGHHVCCLVYFLLAGRMNA